MTSDARRTRGDAWAWALLSLFGPPSADGGDDGRTDEKEVDVDAGAGAR
jgi:hypothetical protein